METIELKIYKIKKFGYYSRKQGVNALDDSMELLQNLKAWMSGLRIVDNCTYAGTDAPGSDKTLCVSIVRNPPSNDLIITMWAGIDVGDKNAVGAITPQANPDNVQVEENSFTPDSVPGYPIYFYVIPEYNLVTPVKINGSKNGIVGFNKYMNGFLQRCSKYVNYEVAENGDRKISHYGNSEHGDYGYYPGFSYSNWQRGDMAGFLREKREDIKRVIKKDLTVRGRDGGILQRLFHIQSANDDRMSGARFKYELDLTPSADELNAYIEECEADANGDVDYGFKIGSDVHWVSHSIQKHTFSANLRRRRGILYAGSSLLETLTGHRQRIIDGLSTNNEDGSGDEDE